MVEGGVEESQVTSSGGECPVTLMDTCKRERNKWGVVLCNDLRLLILVLLSTFLVYWVLKGSEKRLETSFPQMYVLPPSHFSLHSENVLFKD